MERGPDERRLYKEPALTHDDYKSPADLLEGVVSNRATDFVTIYEIKSALHERGFALLIIMFAAISAVTPPGVTPVPALPIVLLSLQMAAGRRDPWLPAWLGNKKIKRIFLASMIEKATPLMRRVERVLHARLLFFTRGAGERILGALMLLFSLSIMIPLPLTNLLPAVGIILICFGIVGRDGVLALAGALIGVAGVGMALAVLFFGTKAIDFLKNFAAGLF